jgi:hypothetical protein
MNMNVDCAKAVEAAPVTEREIADSTGFYVLKAFPNESIDGFAWGNGPFLALHHWEAAFGLASTYYLSSKNTAPTAHRIR